jgi:hypothetical protein
MLETALWATLVKKNGQNLMALLIIFSMFLQPLLSSSQSYPTSSPPSTSPFPYIPGLGLATANSSITEPSIPDNNTAILSQIHLRKVLSLALASGNLFPSPSYVALLPAYSPFLYIPGLGPSKAIPPTSIAFNVTDDARIYENPLLGVSLKYPATWSAVELKSTPSDNKFPGPSVALLIAPPDNATDYREKALLTIQDFSPVGNITLSQYTDGSLREYNQSDTIDVLETSPTTLAGQPAHQIIFTEDVQDERLKKNNIWTVTANKAYSTLFSAQVSRYDDYLPIFEKIKGSLQISAMQSSFSARPALETAANLASPSSAAPSAPALQTGGVRQDLTFKEKSIGIELQYPDYWTRVQPRAQSDSGGFTSLVSFISPPRLNTNTSSIEDIPLPSFSQIDVGIHDLRRASSNVTGENETGTNVNLEEYTAIQAYSIEQQGGNITDFSENGTMGNLPAHRISYSYEEDGDEKQSMQIWTVKADKGYHFIYKSDRESFIQDLPIALKMLESLNIN